MTHKYLLKLSASYQPFQEHSGTHNNYEIITTSVINYQVDKQRKINIHTQYKGGDTHASDFYESALLLIYNQSIL